VIGGNERVVRPRLADAKFFFDQDRKKTLESRVDGAVQGGVPQQARHPGRARPARGDIAGRHRQQQLRPPCPTPCMPRLASRCSRPRALAKTDLLTDMVGEFPELQGIMGGYYARHDGLREDVAFAIEDHYKPRFAGDELPRNRWAWWWHWPTSWKRWWACSASATCPAATRTRSRCAAMRWASSAC
jgi:glycyl-tRNA synthetase beta chain